MTPESLGNLNGDGVTDIYVRQGSIGGLASYKQYWFRSGKTGSALWSKSFTDPTHLSHMGSDMDGDGTTEIIASPLLWYYGSPPASTTVKMFRGSNGALKWSQTLTGAYWLYPVGDMNDHGRHDVLVCSVPTASSGGKVSFKAVAKNGVNGANLWQKTGLSIPVPPGITWAEIGWNNAYSYGDDMGDLNGDGKDDVAFGTIFYYYKFPMDRGNRAKYFFLSGNGGGTLSTFYIDIHGTRLGLDPYAFYLGPVSGRRAILIHTDLVQNMFLL